MKSLQKILLRDEKRALTPVYVPGETYAFIINPDTYFTDPNWDLLGLRVVNARTGFIAADNFATLRPAYPFPTPLIYQLFCRFPFPYIPNGQYRFEIYSAAEDITLRAEDGQPLLAEDGTPLLAESYSARIKSNVILVENDVLDTTSQISFRHRAAFYGSLYDWIAGNFPGEFKQIFRLPISQVDIQFESEKKTYRNVTDRKLRTVKSYRDSNVKFQAFGLDDEAHEALSAAIEHDTLEINGVPLEPKTALNITTNPTASLNNSTFDAYASFEERHGIMYEFGDTVIICGTATYHPTDIIEP